MKRDFYEAFWWLSEHPHYQYEFGGFGTNSFFQQAIIEIEVVKVNPKNNTIEDDKTLNTKTQVWIEPGTDFNNEWGVCETHEWFLDCGGDTFEEAIINLAEDVFRFYGDGNVLLIDPTSDLYSDKIDN